MCFILRLIFYSLFVFVYRPLLFYDFLSRALAIITCDVTEYFEMTVLVMLYIFLCLYNVYCIVGDDFDIDHTLMMSVY